MADKKYLELVREAIPGFKDSNFIDEPSPKNTAPCLILSNIALFQIDEDANVVVVPADHYIPDIGIFAAQINDALNFADSKFIITSGIKPNMPHTGYGCCIELEKTLHSKIEFNNIYNAIKPESIDYALMEKVKEVKMFKAGFRWNDVGAWPSVYELISAFFYFS